MDDSCAVCADALEWVAYGPCGHREVCSTCVVRLRVVLEDPRCCICKTDCPSVFVTKAMGDYTKVIYDFSVLPTDAKEGKVGEYWYHEDTRAYFDDADHYKMIRAMCRLSCSVCDKAEEDQAGQAAQAKRRSSRFKSIGLLKRHLSHRHDLTMCNLCLEGRKVFICEQKIYTREQLARHTQTGDPEVDGSQAERSGFAGHPICEFCIRALYGDNELYAHMSRRHYSCHICQRRHPGNYDYFRNYDDLEMHFRKDHFLCEDDACLAKKFVVFQSDAEINRHNAMEHGGRMARSRRNAALQIPTGFIYQRNEQDQRRGRGRGRNAHHDSRPDRDFSLPVPERGGSATADHGLGSRVDSVAWTLQSSSVSSSSGRTETGRSLGNGRVLEQLSFPPLQGQDIPDARMDAVPGETSFPPLSEHQSKYALALNQSSRGSARLGDESLFPPLPGSSNKGSASAQQGLQTLAKDTFASRLQPRSKGTVKVLNSCRSQTAENPEMVPHVSTSTQTWPTPADQGLHLSGSSHLGIVTQSTRDNGLMPPASSGSAWNSRASNKMKHSVSAPSFVSGGSSAQASSSRAYGNKNQLPPQSSQPLPVAEDVRQANKSLLERMRVAFGMDADRFSAFKEIACEYRDGVKVQEGEAAVLSKDGYRRSSKEKIPLSAGGSSSVTNMGLEGDPVALSKASAGTSRYVGKGGGSSSSSSSKQSKKTSKFLRVRLGDNSLARLDFSHRDVSPERPERETQVLQTGLPVRSVWKNGAAQKLFSGNAKK